MIVLRAVMVALVAGAATGASAADCPRKDALGTSRVMTVDPQAFPRVGLKSFPQSLPLADKEVVLTFDDGPYPATTTKVLPFCTAVRRGFAFSFGLPPGSGKRADKSTVRGLDRPDGVVGSTLFGRCPARLKTPAPDNPKARPTPANPSRISVET